MTRGLIQLVTDRATGMEKVVLREPGGATAEIYLYGGHLTSWRNKEGDGNIFLSSKASFKLAKTIRGGIQVCFPHFSGSGAPEQHSFASNLMWQLDPNPPPPPPPASASTSSVPGNKPYIDLILTPAEAEMEIWPHNFRLYQRITLGLSGELTSDIRVHNMDTKPYTFTFALLNYLPISNIDEVRIAGLATLDFLDSLKKKRKKEKDVSITFISKVDRIYLGTPNEIAITDLGNHRWFVMKKAESLPDIVVWNAARKKKGRFRACVMPDVGDDEYQDEYKHMLCVGPAAVETAITLQPGEQWTASQEISSVHYFGQQDLPGS